MADTFWVGGYEGTSLDRVSEATGLSKSSLYAAFGNKEAMYVDAMRHFAEEMRKLVEPALRQAGTLRERLLHAHELSIAHYLSEGPGRGCLILCTGPAAAAGNPVIAAELRAIFGSVEALMIEVFSADRAQLRKGVAPQDAALLAIALQHALADRARAGAPAPELLDFSRRSVAAMPWA
ncbi:TetR/AcrR family transcriptional regulator [Qipengyuania qiaonensis]|uniref:TetR/AcrR family transcriptional regulator n=1 Tax=Qipengyuania qiaonensis TaxID=2867240 RepID=A0ABS7J6W2_9SPHN|nr:TetR/AcrR family transcriptional regulator [Qipengyuania qiaonensis]MBX7481725.1 TetR/AcrR family transcriptional regulator [Qipengyuania qiaonensis]